MHSQDDNFHGRLFLLLYISLYICTYIYHCKYHKSGSVEGFGAVYIIDVVYHCIYHCLYHCKYHCKYHCRYHQSGSVEGFWCCIYHHQQSSILDQGESITQCLLQSSLKPLMEIIIGQKPKICSNCD